MIQQASNIERNRITSLTPDKGLIDETLDLVRYYKSMADTGANRAIWGNNLQVIYLDSTLESLAIVEADKDKSPVIYSSIPYTLSDLERLELIAICEENNVNYDNDIQAITSLNNQGIAIIKLNLI